MIEIELTVYVDPRLLRIRGVYTVFIKQYTDQPLSNIMREKSHGTSTRPILVVILFQKSKQHFLSAYNYNAIVMLHIYRLKEFCSCPGRRRRSHVALSYCKKKMGEKRPKANFLSNTSYGCQLIFFLLYSYPLTRQCRVIKIKLLYNR